jgi:hypothetical protein
MKLSKINATINKKESPEGSHEPEDAYGHAAARNKIRWRNRTPPLTMCILFDGQKENKACRRFTWYANNWS